MHATAQNPFLRRAMQHALMIVDDSPLERLITETLAKRSLPAEKIASFSSGIDALQYLEAMAAAGEEFPRAILLDIHMPVMTGFDFLDRYIQFPDRVTGQCKVVMFSSTENAEDHARMRKYPVIYKFLPKPLSHDSFEKLSYLWT